MAQMTESNKNTAVQKQPKWPKMIKVPPSKNVQGAENNKIRAPKNNQNSKKKIINK